MTKTPSPQTEKQISAAFARHQTKAALLRARLAKPGGVSMAEMMQLTGWQAHTLRAALTGLRKSILIFTRRRDGSDTIYGIEDSRTLDGPVVGASNDAIAPVVRSAVPDGNARKLITEPGKGAA